MIKILTYLAALFFLIGCKNEEKTATETNNSSKKQTEMAGNFGIVIHGGAGTILKENLNDSLEAAYKAKLKEAITAGYQILNNGGTSLDAVTHSINIMEDSPLFNAGNGAVLTH